jgi:hypothetical protein
MSNKPSEKKHALLDTIASEFLLKNDAHVARFIGVQPAAICKYRAGMAVSDSTKVKIMRATNWPIARVDKLDPPKA